MIGMVIVTHGNLAEEFKSALQHVVGPQEQCIAISIGAEDDMEHRQQDIVNAVKEVNSGSGVVIFTDMLGGTPSNLAISVMDGISVEVLAGVNLPMLIKLASIRVESKLGSAVVDAQAAGQDYIKIGSQVFSDGV